jgi:hypothetical protein
MGLSKVIRCRPMRLNGPHGRWARGHIGNVRVSDICIITATGSYNTWHLAVKSPPKPIRAIRPSFRYCVVVRAIKIDSRAIGDPNHAAFHFSVSILKYFT